MQNGTPVQTDQILAQIDEAWRIRARDPAGSQEIAGEVLAQAEEIDFPTGIGRALVVLAYADMRHAEYERGIERAERGLEICRREGDRLWEGWGLFVLGVLSRWTGVVEQGEDLYRQAIDIARQLDRPDLEAFALNGLGNLANNAGEFEKAQEYFQQCAGKGREVGDPEAEVYGLRGEATSWIERGVYDRAAELLEVCRRRVIELDIPYFLDSVDSVLCFVLRARGDLTGALDIMLKLWKRNEEQEEWRDVVMSILALVDYYYELGEFGRAGELLREGLEHVRRHPMPDMEASLNLRLGALYEATEEEGDGLVYFLRGWQLSVSSNDVLGQLTALFYLGRWHRYHGNEPKAIAFYLRVLRIAEQSNALTMIRATTQALGNCYMLLDMGDVAEDYFRRSMEAAEQTGDLTELGRAFHAIGAYEANREEYGDADRHYAEAREIFRKTESRDLELHLLRDMIESARSQGKTRRVRRLEAERRDLSNLLFTSESARRLPSLFSSVEAGQARMQGEELGLEEADLEQVDEAARQWRTLLGSRPGVRKKSAGLSSRASSLSDRTEQIGESLPSPRDDHPTGRIVVRTLGTFEVIVDGRQVPTTAWKRKRARDLFKLLLIFHRQVVSVSRIEEKLWGEPMPKIESLVANAASHVRSALGLAVDRSGDSPSLSRIGEGYLLDLGDDAAIDFVLFQEKIIAARREEKGSGKLDLYNRCLELFSGDFLPEESSVWTEHQRMLLNDAWYEGAEFVAREELRRGGYDQAVETARTILERDNTNESAWSVLITALIDRGRPAEAQAEYQRCIACFRSEFGEDPPEGMAGLLPGRA